MVSYGVIAYSRGRVWCEGPESCARGFLAILMSDQMKCLLCWFPEEKLDQNEITILKKSEQRAQSITERLSSVGFTTVQEEIMNHRLAIDYSKHLNVFDIAYIQKYFIVSKTLKNESGGEPRTCGLVAQFGLPISMTSEFVVELPDSTTIGFSRAKHKFVLELQGSLGLINQLIEREEDSTSDFDFTILNPISEDRIMLIYREKQSRSQVADRAKASCDKPSKLKDEVAVGEFGFAVLEKFAKVTSVVRMAKGALNSLYSANKPKPGLHDTPSASPRANSISSYAPISSSSRLYVPSSYPQLNMDESKGMPTDIMLSPSVEYEALIATGKCVARDTLRHLDMKSVLYNMSPEGTMTTKESSLRKIAFKLGMDRDARPLIWGYLLVVYPFDSTQADRDEINAGKIPMWEERKDEWINIINKNSDIKVSGGEDIESDASRTVLAGDEDPSMTYEDVIVGRSRRIMKDLSRVLRLEDENLNSYISSTRVSLHGESAMPPTMSAVDEEACEENDAGNSDMEDMWLTLMYYAHKDNETGYVQGMCDILSIIRHVFSGNTHLSYLMFESFMKKIGRTNFSRDQSGISSQMHLLNLILKFLDSSFYNFLHTHGSSNLFFCFRWILVFFIREFSRDEVVSIWDSILSCPVTPYYHLFIALAIINKYRRACAAFCKNSDDTFRFFSNLCFKISLRDIMVRAEALLRAFILKFVGEVYSTLKPELYDVDLIRHILDFAIDTSTPDPRNLGDASETLSYDDFREVLLSYRELYDSIDRSICSESELLKLMGLFRHDTPGT